MDLDPRIDDLFERVKKLEEIAENWESLETTVIQKSEDGRKWKSLNVMTMIEVEKKLEAIKIIMYGVCDYYGTETCREGVCDCDPNGWEGCLTRKILGVLEPESEKELNQFQIPVRVAENGDAVLQIVAIEVCNSNHGDFLKHMAHTWLSTDRENRSIVRPPWKALVDKYELEKEYADAIAEHLEGYLR